MKTRLLGISAVGLLAFFASACGGSSSSGGGSAAASCTLSSANLCVQFDASNLSSAQLSAASAACSSNGLTFADAACSQTNIVAGHCALSGSTIGNYLPNVPISSAAAYFYSPLTSTTAQGFCTATLGGTWVP